MLDYKKCDKCHSYGECDHLGAYQVNDKWCYEDSGGEKELSVREADLTEMSKLDRVDSNSKPPEPICPRCKGYGEIMVRKREGDTPHVEVCPRCLNEPREDDYMRKIVEDLRKVTKLLHDGNYGDTMMLLINLIEKYEK